MGVKKVSQEEMAQEEESQENQDINRLEQEELSEKNIAKLINKTLKEGNQEAKYYLRLSEWNRPGSSFIDYGIIRVLHGEIEKVLLENIYDYPATNEDVYAIIPKTKLVVLLHENGDDFDGKLVEHQTLYVFSYQTGWKSIDLF